MWSIVGHEFAVELLARSIKTRKISHAYLLAGPSRIGKTTLARELAQTLNCAASEPPCGVCRSCQLAQADKHPDIRVIAPENNRIKIEKIRELQNAAALSPVEGRYRVFVISQIDAATPSAANCLLKTLEEPPERVVLILTADRAESLLPTIISRCQMLALRSLTTGQIISALQARHLSNESATLLAHLAQGQIGWALEAAHDDKILERRKQFVQDLFQLNDASCTERFDYAEQLAKKPDQIPDVLHVMSSLWHDILLVASKSTVPIANIDHKARLDHLAAHTSIDTAFRVLDSIQKTAQRLELNANPRLSLEVLLLDLP
ncbi:MAG: DNA polymerase III subunit delta' [Anaerolineae bacterium]|nr:DNA polymerase III subunit delta' [Anaerolineae bacterium]